MIPALSAPPHGDSKPPKAPNFPPGWRWDARLEYDERGFLLPEPSLLRRAYRWVCRQIGRPE